MPGYESYTPDQKHARAKQKMDIFDSLPTPIRTAIAEANHGIIAHVQRFWYNSHRDEASTLRYISDLQSWHKLHWRAALADGTLAKTTGWQAPPLPSTVKARKQVQAVNDLLD